jgi:hypothetical protein
MSLLHRCHFLQTIALAIATILVGGSGPAEKQFELASWLGVYKHRFDNALSDGTRYESENILEIAAVDEANAYVRADLQFTNGHVCRFYGIAQVEAAKLTYRARAGSAMGDQCVLSLERTGAKLVLHDAEGRCGMRTCGVRGFYERVEFPVASRRRIRYLPRLKASYQFQQAIVEVSRE